MKSAIFTRGKGPYGKVYERLRKRSLRLRDRRIKRLLGNAASLDLTLANFDHWAYVRGVHDALIEVEKELRSS